MIKNEQCPLMDRIAMGVGKLFRDVLRVDRGMKQNVHFQLFGPDGRLKAERRIKNTVTTAGKNGVADQALESPTLAKPGWMEVGTGAGGTTKLNTYISGSRTALSSKTRENAVVTMVCTFGAGVGTGAITECGVFDVVTEDTVNMWMYSSFAAINKAAADTLTVTWTLTVS